MMTDLISREALIKELNELRRYVPVPSYKDVFDILMKAKAIEQDKQVPSFAWALIMETAASFEVASYSISDADAKKSAEGAIKYARDTANKYYTAPQPAPSEDDVRDAERYRWLVADHDNKDTRQKCRDLLSRLGVMSYSAASSEIDQAIAQEVK